MITNKQLEGYLLDMSDRLSHIFYNLVKCAESDDLEGALALPLNAFHSEIEFLDWLRKETKESFAALGTELLSRKENAA